MREKIKNNQSYSKPYIKENFKFLSKIWCDNYMRLNEAWHLYNPDSLSYYRKNLTSIINNISNNILKERLYEKVFKNSNISYTEFIYDEPFIDDKILGCLNKLKIYISFDDTNTDAFTINDNNEDDKIINKFLPVLKYNDIRPIIVSIFITLPESIKDNKVEIIKELNNSIPHELKHILDNIYNKIAIEKQSDINELIMEIEEVVDKNRVSDDEIFGMCQIISRDEFLWFISECLYLTQETEITAYLETTYSEYKNSRNLSLSDSFVYRKYRDFNNLIKQMLIDINLYVQEYEEDINYILEKINSIYKIKLHSFKDLLQYWLNLIGCYQKKAHYVYFKVKEQKEKQ